jgi:hypothetical protein
MIVAIDAGNGWTKATASGHPPVQFPSLLAAADTQWLDGYGAPPFLVDQTGWRVGEDARYEPNPIWPGPRDRLRNPHVAPLVAEALWRLGAEGATALATGLPLRVYATEAAAAAHAWRDRLVTLQRGREIRTVQVTHCDVYPQGIAALVALYPGAREERRWPADGLVGLVDVGRGTTELVVVEAATRQARLALCTSFETGVGTAVSQLQRWLQDQVGAPVATDQAEAAWMTGRLHWRNTPLDAHAGRRQALDAVGGRLGADIQHWWRDQWANLQLIILVGSSAAEWRPVLEGLHPNVWVPAQPGLVNVRGYLMMAAPHSGLAGTSVGN